MVLGALGYLSAARLRTGGDPRPQVAIDLAEAQFRMFAFDPPAAAEIAGKVLTRADLSAAAARQATYIRDLARLSARMEHNPDYSRCPYSHPRYWAPFKLVGDGT